MHSSIDFEKIIQFMRLHSMSIINFYDSEKYYSRECSYINRNFRYAIFRDSRLSNEKPLIDIRHLNYSYYIDDCTSAENVLLSS